MTPRRVGPVNKEAAYRRLRSLRWASRLVFIAELVAVGGCAIFLLRNSGHLRPLLQTILPLLFFWQVLPLLAARFGVRNTQRVKDSGNQWRIGRYSEQYIRSLAQEATAGLPDRLRNSRIMIASRRGTGGWTRLSLLWPGRQRRKTIWITEGSLHYLEPDELKALVVHESAHHLRENRCDAPGGWLLGDAALFCLVFWMASRLYLDAGGVLVVFCVVRFIAIGATMRILNRASQAIEHLCDLYGAARAGCGAMVNVLLKSGEEEELVETVLRAWLVGAVLPLPLTRELKTRRNVPSATGILLLSSPLAKMPHAAEALPIALAVGMKPTVRA